MGYCVQKYIMKNLTSVTPPPHLYYYLPINPLTNNRHTRYYFCQYNGILSIRSVLLY